MTEDKNKAAEKILGNPVFGDLSENALKVRRNLLVTATISLILTIGNIKLDTGSSIFGFKFIGVTNEHIFYSLIIFNVYFLSHFIWYVTESFMEWRIRITGTKVAFITAGTFGNESADYPTDPRQSSLYNWWKDAAKQFPNYKETEATIKEKIDELTNAINQSSDRVISDVTYISSQLTQISKELVNLNSNIKSAEKVVTSDRIPASLERFDNWFKFFICLQNLRWFLVDAAFPILMAIVALLFLA